MRKIIATAMFVIMGTLSCSNVFADTCDWSTITVNKDGSRTYPLALHLCVGQLVQDMPLKDKQIAELNRVITLKDLALQQETNRANMWQETSLKLTETVNKYESARQTTEVVAFGLGIATVALSAWALGQVKR